MPLKYDIYIYIIHNHINNIIKIPNNLLKINIALFSTFLK